MILNFVQSSVRKLDTTLLFVAQQVNVVDKVRIVLFVTWVWALAGLYVTKAFESFFKLILKMPDNWLSMAAPTSQRINQNESVRIVAAHDGKSDITNKFKLFLKYYWEDSDLNNGFSFDSFHKLLNCSMLYCSYLMTDKNGAITPERFWRNVDKFLVELRDDKCVKYDNIDLSNTTTLPFNMVNFDKVQKNKTAHNKNLIDLINSINS